MQPKALRAGASGTNTMGTRHDRMQYELPATGAHAHHAPDAAAARRDAHAGMDHIQHAGMDHSAHGKAETDHSGHATMDHSAHGGGAMDHSAHGDMGHDMSDPSEVEDYHG